MPREPGVGAELTSPSTGEVRQYNKNDKHFMQPVDLSQDEKVRYPGWVVNTVNPL